MSRQNVCWVLTQAYPYEGEALYGVYTSKEAAESARDATGERPSYAEWCIYEVEIDAAARDFGWHDREANRDA